MELSTNLDKFIGIFSPRRMMERTKFRYLSQVFLDNVRKYKAAGTGRRAKGWIASGSDANNEIKRDGKQLRNRHREMARNNTYSSKALRALPANIVGAGIRVSISTKSSKDQEALNSLWKNWAEEVACDFDDRKTFYGIQRLAMRSVIESGDVFIRQIRDTSLEIPFQLQILEADFLDTAKDGISTESGGYIDAGIEFSAKGKRVAYWIFQQHPGSNRVWKDLNSVRVPASQVIHLFYEERPQQQLGVPEGASSLLKLRDFDEYEEAQLIRQKIAACFTAFVTSNDDPNPSETDKNNMPLERVEPGMIEYLPAGKTVTFGTPPNVENFAEYSEVTLRGAAAGYGMTYEAMTGDLSKVNFSSGRMGWIEFGRIVQEWQNEIVITQLCKSVFSWFLAAARLKGYISEKTIVTTEWTPPRREMIDPVKEINGLKETVRAGFNSWQDVIRQQGLDPAIVLRELSQDLKSFDTLGLMLTSDARYDANRSDGAEDGGSGADNGAKQAKKTKKAIK